jgi:hypothetical protein
MASTLVIGGLPRSRVPLFLGLIAVAAALALALPAGVVSAADLDVRGGIGERQYRPLAADQVRDTYRLGVGQLIVDLRDAKLPPGDRRLHLDLGVGQAVLVVPRDVCVATSARLGAGEVDVFDRNSGGVDVDWQDERTAPPGRTRLIVDGDVGVGQLAVTYQDPDAIRHRGFHDDAEPGNRTCIGGARG